MDGRVRKVTDAKSVGKIVVNVIDCLGAQRTMVATTIKQCFLSSDCCTARTVARLFRTRQKVVRSGKMFFELPQRFLELCDKKVSRHKVLRKN